MTSRGTHRRARCSASGCTNKRGSKDSEEKDNENPITFHKFPFHHGNDMVTKWTNALGVKNFVPSVHTVVCSDHFEEDCYTVKFEGLPWSRKVIKPDAVPTKFDFSKNKKERKRTSQGFGDTNAFNTEAESQSGHDQVCCLIDNSEKCQRQAGNASYSKRVQNQALKLSKDESSPHIYICDYHKSQIQSVRTKRKRKDSEDNGEEESVEIDFYQMPVNTLRRYNRHYKLNRGPGLSKAQLADNVASHFKTIPVVEKDTLQMFFYTTKTKQAEEKDLTS